MDQIQEVQQDQFKFNRICLVPHNTGIALGLSLPHVHIVSIFLCGQTGMVPVYSTKNIDLHRSHID